MTERSLRIIQTVLSLLGIGIAGYLTYVHYSGIEPLCTSDGGGCEKVQSSDQSMLIGLPVALYGLLAYITLFAASFSATDISRALSALTGVIGFGFSIYLTYESVTVIEATCQWCLASTALMTLMAIITVWRLLKT